MARPKKVKMKGVPKGAFGGIGDTVQGMVNPTRTGTRGINAGVRRIMKHPKFPGTKN